MNAKLELTWVGKLRQWRKRRFIDGKRKDFYLGTGNGKGDRESYERALKKWRLKEAELDAHSAQRRLEDTIAELEAESRLAGTLEAKSALKEQIKQLRSGTSLSDSQAQRKLQAEIRCALSRKDYASVLEKTGQLLKDELPPKPKALGEFFDEYLADQRRRYEHGLQFPDAPQKKRISAVRLMAYRNHGAHLRADWAEEPLPADEGALYGIMKRFQSRQQDLLTGGKIMPNTYNERVKVLRHFVRWLHAGYKIPVIPRGTQELCANYNYRSTAKALDVPLIQRLWAAGSNRFRLYMALALNCGYYAVDIAHLKLTDIRGDYIVADRHKTGVPTRYKLWGVTKRLLKQECAKSGDLALLAPEGGPLISYDMSRGNGVRWCKIENDLAAIKKRLKLKGVSFSHFRDTSSTKIESINRNLTDVFDAHKDQRMARRYIDHGQVDQDRLFRDLDAAIDELEAFYGLILD